jgi:protein-tyrosine kinase
MSIVEKTLKIMQASGATQRPDAPLLPGAAGLPVQAPSRRVLIGNASKVVHIDRDRLRAAGLLPPAQQHELANQYRTLKRPLIKHAFESTRPAAAAGAASMRSIMISSALSGEGKTFTSVNLAMSLALERDHSVLLVDGDVPKPHVTSSFGLQHEPGLLDVLIDPSVPIESVVLPTDIAGFSILPVGSRAESTPELLASARMRQVIARLEQLDPQALIIVDSPPILLTSEARVLASLFGQVVLVVRAESTPQQAVTESIEIIGDGPRIGLVLNQATRASTKDNSYGHYYSGSSGSAEKGEKEATRSGSGTAHSADARK